jgi:hypothetical protein
MLVVLYVRENGFCTLREGHWLTVLEKYEYVLKKILGPMG